MSSDDEATYGVGRRAQSSSSREPSPVLKRSKRSFTPTSDDGDLVVPATNDGATDSPPPENAPLIRKPVGFSWTPSTSTTDIQTYEAPMPAPPATSYFLPGQAPPKPQKTQRKKTNRKKKCQEYSAQTGRFRLGAPASVVPTPRTLVSGPQPCSPSPAGESLIGGHSSDHTVVAASSRSSLTPLVPPTTSSVSYPDGMVTTMYGNVAAGSSHVRNIPAPHMLAISPKVPERHKTRAAGMQPDARSVESANHGIRSVSNVPNASPNTMLHDSPGKQDNAATSQARGSNIQRPLRMVTLLIEDLRGATPDSQLAEVKVPLKPAEDPEDGFWADAVDICNALQASPSRIDGPGKVYTLRGKFRQIFMRIDQQDNHHVTSAHLGVSKQRTLDAFVEPLAPRGQLPPPAGYPNGVRSGHNSDSDSETLTHYSNIHPQIRVPTRDEQIETLSKISYVTPKSKSLPRSNASTPKRKKGKSHVKDQGDTRPTAPPTLATRVAESQEERDEAITRWIKSKVESHPDFVQYMQSIAKLQRVSEVLKQCNLVDNISRQLAGLKTPADCDGAPDCLVTKEHVYRALNLSKDWCERHEEMLSLVGFYGKNGTRYEDPHIVSMIDDMSVPKPNVMEKFMRVLNTVHQDFTEEMLGPTALPDDDGEE